MVKFTKLFIAGFALVGYQQISLAGAPTPVEGIFVSNKQTQTKMYAGLVWNLNNKIEIAPDYVSVGARSVSVKSNDNVSGADLSIRFGVKKGVALDSTRLSYVAGNRDVQGNLGIGYSYVEKSFLGTLGAASGYSRLGGDLLFNKSGSFTPFVEVNTLPRPKKVNEKLGGEPG